MIAEDFSLDLLSLTNPQHPGRPLPDSLAELMPDPMRSSTDFARFTCDDIANLSPAERAWETIRLRTVAAVLPYEEVPAWIFSRLAALRTA